MRTQPSITCNVIDILVSLYIYEEDGKVVVYAPTLKLFVYSESEDETLKLFTAKLHLFILEVYNKGRFNEVFEDLGWKVFKSGLAVELDPPTLTELKNSDAKFQEILATKKYKRLRRTLELRTFPDWYVNPN